MKNDFIFGGKIWKPSAKQKAIIAAVKEMHAAGEKTNLTEIARRIRSKPGNIHGSIFMLCEKRLLQARLTKHGHFIYEPAPPPKAPPPMTRRADGVWVCAPEKCVGYGYDLNKYEEGLGR